MNRRVRVILVEIDPKTGCQKYQCSTDPEEIIFLAGIDRAANVKKGDIGYLEYARSSSRGYYFFHF